jgi:hypothetical protein
VDEDTWASLVDQLDESEVLLARIEIVRYLDKDGADLVMYRADDPSGDDLALTETLGMLRLTEDTAIRDRFDAPGDDLD